MLAFVTRNIARSWGAGTPGRVGAPVFVRLSSNWPSNRAGGSFEAKKPGTEGQPAERVAWPVNSRGRFFAMQGEEEVKSKPTLPEESPKQALDKLVKDLEELREQNPGLTVEAKNGGNEVVIRLKNRPDVSLFRLVVQGRPGELGFETSSAPGQVRSYKRNEFGDWVCTKDGHNLHGLFVRDLLPYIKGMPRFASA